MPSWSGRWGEPECPHGPCSAPAWTDGMDSHGMRESLCRQSGATRPKAGWENRGGATRHNETIRRLRGWRRGSRPSAKNKGEMNQYFIHRTETTNQNPKINHDDNKTLTQILFKLTTISQNSADWKWCRIRKNVQYESDREFWDTYRKHKYVPIRLTVQELSSLKVGGATGTQFWTY
jgi:hypothetical protein